MTFQLSEGSVVTIMLFLISGIVAGVIFIVKLWLQANANFRMLEQHQTNFTNLKEDFEKIDEGFTKFTTSLEETKNLLNKSNRKMVLTNMKLSILKRDYAKLEGELKTLMTRLQGGSNDPTK